MVEYHWARRFFNVWCTILLRSLLMLLCIDIGNTNIKLGLFDGDQIRSHWRITTDPARLADEYAMLLLNLFASNGLQASQVTGCAISSVVPVLAQVFGEI